MKAKRTVINGPRRPRKYPLACLTKQNSSMRDYICTSFTDAELNGRIRKRKDDPKRTLKIALAMLSNKRGF